MTNEVDDNWYEYFFQGINCELSEVKRKNQIDNGTDLVANIESLNQGSADSNSSDLSQK